MSKRNTSYWKNRLEHLDDEELREVEEAVLERGASVDDIPNDEIVHIKDLQDEINEEYNNWGKVNGLKTGLPSLDEKLAGMGNGHVILVGGETSNGKSALAANIAVNVSKNVGVLFITLEMRRAEIGARIMHINDGKIDDLNIMFQSEHRLTYKDIKPLIRKAIEKGEVKMVFLDYLQYLGRGMTEKEIAIMSKEIKTLALEFSIPFMVIVSLRKSEGGKNKRKWTDIEIEDYMGTGAIGYDCDAAVIASRKDMNNNFDTNHVYVKVLKTRNTNLDYQDRYLMFDWNQTKISEDFTTSARPNLEVNDGFVEAGDKDIEENFEASFDKTEEKPIELIDIPFGDEDSA